VIATIRGISASIASIIAALQNKAGTKMIVASQLVTFFASKQSLNTGTSR